MPLPDANNYSTRIYELLKETDLQNLSYSQFQNVAETLFIEPENEDEMRRLVLVQLARMAVRGDWDGFLTGGGGSGGAPTDAEYVVMSLNGTLTNERVLTAGTGISITDAGAGSTVTIAATGGGGSGVYSPVLPDTDIDSTGRDNLYMISRFPPWGSNSSSTSSTTVGDSPQYRPFVSPRSGDVLSIVMNVNSTTDEPNYDIGIYSDSDGVPDALLGKATAALTIAEGTGTITLTPSSTITTVAGTQYHIGWVRTDVSGAGNFTAESNGSLFWCGPISPNFPNLGSLNQMVTIIQSGTDNVLPATVTATDCEMTYNNPPRWGLVWS